MEVRPKAGARTWSNAGEMVIPVIHPQRTTGNRAHGSNANNETYFLFMGGKGYKTVNHAGETDGTIQ